MRIDDINAMAEKDIIKNEINKLAEEVYLEHENNDILYGNSLELRLTYKAGVVDGYNKAKERMYSEEDMSLAFETGRNFQLTGENNFVELIEQFNKQ